MLATLFEMLDVSLAKTQARRMHTVSTSMSEIKFCIVRMNGRYGEYTKKLSTGQYIHQVTAINYQRPELVTAIYGRWDKGSKQYHVIIELSGGELIIRDDIKFIAKNEDDYFDTDKSKSKNDKSVCV